MLVDGLRDREFGANAVAGRREHRLARRAAIEASREAELAEHSRIFTRVHRGKVKDRAVEAVISGNRPRAEMEAATTRYSFYDGRSTDLDSGTDAALMPLVSENWTKLFTWQGIGEMPQAERERLGHGAGHGEDGIQPASVARVLIDEEEERIEVVVPDDQLSLAIGKEGQNARLAARLTGWRIDIVAQSKAAGSGADRSASPRG